MYDVKWILSFSLSVLCPELFYFGGAGAQELRAGHAWIWAVWGG